ncbi:MAG TPA: hypothetical protein VFQ61_02590 [Polyangiaceae bacterium]|nr:hypothetical protein [Polyangiaceae bacterium]
MSGFFGPIALSLMLAVGALHCSKGTKSMSSTTKPAESLPALSTELGLSFPASTRLIGVRREAGIDDAVQAKLEMSSADVPAFLASTPLDVSAMRSGTRGFLGADVDFWDPHKASALKTGQGMLPAGKALNIGVDESRGTIAVVYVMRHGT